MLSDFFASHPSRGAWIEISHPWGWKKKTPCRTPHGVRGLKSEGLLDAPLVAQSHPSRGAWIEILIRLSRRKKLRVAPLTGCVD